MNIRKSSIDDLSPLLDLYKHAREYMKEEGNPHQWGDDSWPSKEALLEDINNGNHYIIYEGDTILGAFSFSIGVDPTYLHIDNGNWLNDEPYGVIHKVASAHIHKGIMDEIIKYCFSKIDNLRIDTHKDNIPMNNYLKKVGFHYCDIIYVRDGTPRLAYHKKRADF